MRPAFPQEDLDRIVAETGDLWHDLRGSRWFITGGTGFIGSWLLESIHHANLSVGANIEAVVLSRSVQKAVDAAPHLFTSGDISFVEGDVTSFDMNVGALDVCIHAATDVADPVRAADYARIFDVGVTGTRRVLDTAQKNSASRFLLTSSGAVYGPQPADLERIPESYNGAPDPLDYRTAYGQGKRASEWLAASYSERYAMNVSIARIFALIGPGLPLDGPFAAGNFIRDACRGTRIQVRDGRPFRSYLYAADACIWLLRIMQDGANQGAYNVGAERAVSIAQVARMIEQASDLDQCSTEADAQVPDAHPSRYIPDTSKARRELGLVERTSLESGLSSTINWSRMAAML
ncbi:NAD-dependent epimerase/dehydratase family protein [Paraburkholderia hospita]|jgi:dTDP-glucose 4,6-dehydratase|uniref:NAD(P)-dependent oxidoreductase n=1 Tax=Paraburkholderia hospita TaxID=169430 RepID=A0AAN1MJD8_9BURK|nr:NAD(P)-dependent oxidoreductase [Paraburkholderia hospita]AUT69263.1 NAD(P)-dependent oxidoreductase [Paraburkholderia hospita]SEI16726.1 dTDP-glucose 4,6-dehydratase [Paraburkholderia hospita]